MTAEHADFEALSAFVDGEAPEWADHVAGCPPCRATAAELRALSAQVAAPADSPPAAQREAAIAAALGAADLDAPAGAARPFEPAAAARHEAQRARFGRFAPRSWAMPAIAAVVVALLGLSGVILSANRSTDENATTFAGPALDAKTESAVPGAPAAPVGDLGEVPDAATLRARALAVGAAAPAAGAESSVGRSASSSNSGAASDTQSSATNTGNTGAAVGTSAAGGGAAGGSAAVIAPNIVGTRPCEERARAREPGLGPVTYFATARRGNVPTYVLGFATGPTVTLLMLAQDGCSELLRSAGP